MLWNNSFQATLLLLISRTIGCENFDRCFGSLNAILAKVVVGLLRVMIFDIFCAYFVCLAPEPEIIAGRIIASVDSS